MAEREGRIDSNTMNIPNYDIARILAEHQSAAKVLFTLWECLSPCDYVDLFEEEKVVLDAWSFDFSFGNGINDILSNESYETIANGMRAMLILGLPRLEQFVDTMRKIFSAFEIDCTLSDSIASIEQLPPLERVRLQSQLGEAEIPYLNDFWEAGLLTLAARDYIIANLDVFRRRSPSYSITTTDQ